MAEEYRRNATSIKFHFGACMYDSQALEKSLRIQKAPRVGCCQSGVGKALIRRGV